MELKFNVLNYDVNRQKFEHYDVVPYLLNCYEQADKKPQTFDEFKTFVEKESMYRFWSRCEFEIILVDWPCKKQEEKIDVYDQIMMNIDVVTSILKEAAEHNRKTKNKKQL